MKVVNLVKASGGLLATHSLAESDNAIVAATGLVILHHSTSVDCDICAGGVNKLGTDGGAGGAGGAGNGGAGNKDTGGAAAGAGGNKDGGGGSCGKLNGNALAVGANPKLKTTVETIAVNNFFIGFLLVFTKFKIDKL
ncbi:hypothetical protein ACP6PL_27325 [Dapis sp. BLCC M126]|uniref:hypothetical protein n=1 Tax=Dapis sp. BLCC M126 TaxID=3400189 RepID=UPI003CEB996B